MRIGRLLRQTTLRPARQTSDKERLAGILNVGWQPELRLAAAGCLYGMGLVEHKPGKSAPTVLDWSEFDLVDCCERLSTQRTADSAVIEAAQFCLRKLREETELLRPSIDTDTDRLLRPSAIGEVDTNQLLRPQGEDQEE